MFKSTLLVLSVCLLLNPFNYSKAQDGISGPPLDEIWTALIEHAGITNSEISEVSPSFPSKNISHNSIEKWLNAKPNEAEKVYMLFQTHDVNPSRIQLGLKDFSLTVGQVVPHWQNALDTYGDITDVSNALPHLPNPNSYCDVTGYLKDVDKRESWRSEFGYGSNANELTIESEAPDANLLFDENEYPCLAKYYVAIDKWVYNYPKEYEKLMNACSCGGNEEPIVMHVMPDSLKQPWESPLERIRKAKEQEEAGQQLLSDSNEPIYVPESNPFMLLESSDSDLSQLNIEELINQEGGQAFRDYLFEHLNQEGFEFVIQSSTAWYMQNNQAVYEKIRHASDANETFFVRLSDGSIKVKLIDNDEFVSIFNSQVK
jgi:hypothetical protein